MGAWQARIESKPPDEFDPKTLNGPFIEFESNLGTFHLRNRLPGIDSFDGLKERSVWIEVYGVAVPIASLDDLIAMKSASSREKDQVHLRQLEALRADKKD